MTEIYRIENKKGNGCYIDLEDGFSLAMEKMLGENHSKPTKLTPMPHDDIGIERTPHNNEICGFVNLRQALNWFSQKELKVYRRLVFELKKVMVQKITAIGECQLLAIR